MSYLTRSKLVLTLLTVAGCSQIIGLSDYEIDPSLDEPGSAGETSSGASGGTTNGKGGSTSGGKSSVIPGAGAGGEAGEGTNGQGGSGADGGTTGAAGDGGQNGGGTAAGGDGGQSGGGELVPCDSLNCCMIAGGVAKGVELLQDGGFEKGLITGGESPWTQQSTNDFETITDGSDYGWAPRGGSYYAYLSGVQEEETLLWSEDLQIPADAGWLQLTGYRIFQVDAKNAANTDYGAIGFYGYGENDPVEEPFYWTDPALTGSIGWGDVTSWTPFSASWSATPHQGQERYLQFVGYSDSYPVVDDPDATDASSYLFDSVSFKVFRCYK
jgi:hypothetical protein